MPVGQDKGFTTRQILEQDATQHRGHPDFVCCIGDDSADEPMFRAIYDYMAERSEESVHGAQLQLAPDGTPFHGNLQHVFTCTIGKKPSNAHLYVNDFQDVERLLVELANASSSGSES